MTIFFKLSIFWLIFIFVLSNSALALTPNDPLLVKQWYLDKISAQTAWNRTTGSSEVIVAVLDTGVDIKHPDLSANIWRNSAEIQNDGIDNDHNGYVDDINGWNFVENNNNVRPGTQGLFSLAGLNHGTLIAGMIAAVGNNNEGVAGISWQTKIMPVRVLDSEGSGDSRNIVSGIDYAIRGGADVINLSFTTFDYILALTEAVRRAKDAGIIVVAAAGNDTGTNLDQRPIYPVCSDGPAGENWVLGVSSVDKNDIHSSFSNFGSLCVDLAAPGEKIYGTQFVDSFFPDITQYGNNWSGTSLATPIVSGTVALMRAVAPRLSRTQIINALIQTAQPIDNLNTMYRGLLGRGRVDARAAVELAAQMQALLPNTRFVVSSDSGPPRVRTFDGSGNLVSSFLAYAEGFTGGVRVAYADVDGDGSREIITGAGPGGGPHIRVFNESGQVKNQFFAFTTQFRGGITVAAGDVDGDQRSDIIVGSGRGASPIVKVFDSAGNLKYQFLAYTAAFTGGIEVAAGDIDGDGTQEIITAAGPGGGPHVRAFDKTGNVKGQFFAFENTYRGGLKIAAADVDNDRRTEIIATRAAISLPEVKVFSVNGSLKNSFNAFAANQQKILVPSAFDRESDGRAEILVATNTGGSELRGFSQVGALLLSFELPSELRGALRLAAW